MTQSPPERIDGSRVVLRRPTVDDAERIAATIAGNVEHLGGWLAWVPAAALTVAGQRERIAEVDARWESGEEHRYLVLSPDDTELLGILGLHARVGPGAVEISYWLAERHVGHGYMTDAVAIATAAALDLPGVTRVEIHCDEANHRSAAVPRRLGFRLDRVEDKPPSAPLETGRNQIWVRTSEDADDVASRA